MAEARRVQFAAVVIAAAGIVLSGIVLLSPAQAFVGPAGADVAHPAINRSALGPVLFWCCGWPLVLASGRWASGARISWSLGCALLLTHIAIAFHVGHGWSHQAAWEHTKQVGGYGDGVFVNYAVALVWLADVAWAWVAFDSYRARPRWLTWAVHGFLAFVVFNAAVVFGGWRARATFGFFFGVMLTGIFSEWRRERRSPAEGGRGA